MDRIYMKGMEFYAYHGLLPEENRLGQRFIVDVELFLSLGRAGASDSIEDTVNYAELYRWVEEEMKQGPVRLLETLAERISARILAEKGAIEAVRVDIRKTDPPIPGHYREVGVTVERRRDGR